MKITKEMLSARAAKHGECSKAQLQQDVFVLLALQDKRDGYFVDVGAASGVALSNTYLLEKLGWSGILVEPARCWHNILLSSRRSTLDTRAAWWGSGLRLPFIEPSDAYLASLACRADDDGFAVTRHKSATVYDVTTVSLTDLLIEHEAPPNIDYLSLDTEGSESDILETFDFNKYRFQVITCEHNFHKGHREKTLDLLTKNGYRRVCEDLSSFEDWFVADLPTGTKPCLR